MIKFLKNIVLFLFLALLVGEIAVRVTNSVSEIPQRTIDNSKIQKYLPNQEGYWKGGNHKWTINRLGWPGELPNNYDNLIAIIGDSFIENFMNPNECHQSSYLKKNISTHNFIEAGRSGVSLIEAMEISKQVDSLKPIQTLIYINDNDFFESLSEVNTLSDITQLNLKNNTIEYGKMKSPGLKKVLYNWKLLYYFYNRFPLSKNNATPEESKTDKSKKENSYQNHKENLKGLIAYITNNYNISDKVLVFHPNSNKEIIRECRNSGFKIITLDATNDKSWTFDHDSHWTCYGHKQVANQVANALKNNFKIINK